MTTITETLDHAIEPRIGDLVDQTWFLDDEGTGLLYPDRITSWSGQQDKLVRYLVHPNDVDENEGRDGLPQVGEEMELIA